MSNSRSQAEIERDFKKIRKYVKANEVKSISEIAKALGLSASQVNTSLSKHPRVQKEIMDIITKNNESAKKESEENDQNDSDKEVVTNTPVRFVIDASIAGVEGIQEIIKQIVIIKSKIVITTITIKELDRMKKFADVCGKDSRWILATAANNPNCFDMVPIEENSENLDDDIIEYCRNNRDSCVLMTADNAMALKGRAFGINVRVFKKTEARPYSSPIRRKEYGDNSTLHIASRIGKNLFISRFETETRIVRVISNGIEYNSGAVKLKIGDDVLIASRKEGFVSFSHLKIKNLGLEDNCTYMYGRHIYNSSDIDSMPMAIYKAFMRDVNRKFCEV